MTNKREWIGISYNEKALSNGLSFKFKCFHERAVKVSDFVVVKNSITDELIYGQVQEILSSMKKNCHDTTLFARNYYESDYIPNLKQGLWSTYATVKILASSGNNDDDDDISLINGFDVFKALPEDIEVIALKQQNIPKSDRIPAGLVSVGDDLVPLFYSKQYLLGCEGSHLNITGMSGLATKTSYAMFVLKGIQERYGDDVAIITMNVKGDDLLHIDEPNPDLTEKDFLMYRKSGISSEPFKNVKFLYPFAMKKDNYFARTALNKDRLKEQVNNNLAYNYVFSYEEDRHKLDGLFCDVEDSNLTLDSMLHCINESEAFCKLKTWDELKKAIDDLGNKGPSNNIHGVSWQMFLRFLNNNIKYPIFADNPSGTAMSNFRQTRIADNILNITGGETLVIDIAKLPKQLQQFVFRDVVKTVHALKTFDYDDKKRITDKPIPEHIVIFVEDLNKFAPAERQKSPLIRDLCHIASKGSSSGVILFSAQKHKSAVHDAIKANYVTNVYGRSTATEVANSDYEHLPKAYRDQLPMLCRGQLLIEHPVLPAPIKIRFPRPPFKQGRE